MPPLDLMRLAMASISSVTAILIEKPEALGAVPSLGAIVLIQADAHVAGLERDEHTLAVAFDGTLHAEAQNVGVYEARLFWMSFTVKETDAAPRNFSGDADGVII